jgi:hypothetical protein
MLFEPRTVRPPPSPGGPCERRYVDPSGIAWCVHELSVLNRPPALYFESVGAFRRVSEYPADWLLLTTDEIEILSHKT